MQRMPMEEDRLDPRRSLFFSMLPEEIQARWVPLLVPVHLEVGRTLCDIGQSARHVYFPITAIVSLLKTAADGSSTMLAMVGFEGMVGLPAILSGEAVNGEAMVQSEGRALQLDAGVFTAAFDADRQVRQLVLRYVQAFVSNIGQTALCNRYHTPDEQLCTLLLRVMDRKGQNTILMTHDQLARLTGVRRETISHAASRLQHQGVLFYQRGHIQVPDRQAVERHACDCYGSVEQAYERTFFRGQCPWALQPSPK
jgi:CRP-like cAMP-binding protein